MSKKYLITLVIGFALGVFVTLNYSDRLSFHQIGATDNIAYIETGRSLIPTVYLPIKAQAKEDDWTKDFTEFMGGTSKKYIKTPNGLFGYIDVFTDTYAIEIDYFKKFKEGIGQALFYEKISGKKPALALIIDKDEISINEIIYVEELCFKNGIKLILLKSDTKLPKSL